ncbi:unnamed protein product [Bemisia tabaci]|uniref:Uncharacterized protein n=1 Tax=Bemisia tabaci TaxID=7038 RepID=A0A9P0F8B2_BEMTA|nr:unnamed protein product [Bemisia tabaci]
MQLRRDQQRGEDRHAPQPLPRRLRAPGNRGGRAFAAHNLTGNLVQEAKEWYKGYGLSAHVNRVEFEVYNPYSIAQFIKNKNVTNYWVQTQSVDILGNLFKSSEMEAVFLRLLSGESPKVVLEDQVFSSEELRIIHGALTAPSENAKRDLYLRYLFVAGI